MKIVIIACDQSRQFSDTWIRIVGFDGILSGKNSGSLEKQSFDLFTLKITTFCDFAQQILLS